MMKNLFMKTLCFLSLFIGLFLLLGVFLEEPSAVLAEDLVIIANEVFPADSISMFDLMEIYTGHYVVFKNFKIQPLDQTDDQRIKKAFLNKVVQFTPDGYKAHWLKWTFKTGRQPPLVVSNSIEVIHTVQKDKNGIGYVWAQDVENANGIKVLLKIPVNE
jgi:hypothetical protein